MELQEYKHGVFCQQLGNNCLILHILPLPGVQLHFVGKCEIAVLKGAVKIHGYLHLWSDPSLFIFNPKAHSSLLSIKPSRKNNVPRHDDELEAFLRKYQTYLSTPAGKPDKTKIVEPSDIQGMEGVVIAMIGFDSLWCRGLRKYCEDGESLAGPALASYGKIFDHTKIPKKRSMFLKLGFRLLTDEEASTKRIYEEGERWRNAARPEKLVQAFKQKSSISIATFGGKGVGKSTFNRYWVNQYISHSILGKSTLYVDLDLGQPELTPPGIISVHVVNGPLFGPNFAQLRQPIKAIYIGTANVSDNPRSYVNGMLELARFVRDYDSSVVLNTMGYCTGLGVELAVAAIKIFQPNCVVQIGINNPRRSFPFLLSPTNVNSHVGASILLNLEESITDINGQAQQQAQLDYTFVELESVCSSEKTETGLNQWGSTPKTLRERSLVSYFASEIGDDLLGTSPKMLEMGKIAFGLANMNMAEHQVLDALKGNLVALCKYPDEFLNQAVFEGANPEHSLRLIQFQNRLPDAVIEWLGYGIVRAIDLEEKKIYVLTPLDPKVIRTSVNCVILAGSIGLPNSLLCDQEGTNDPSPYALNDVHRNKLHESSRKQFIPKRAARSALSNSLL